jgi:hypothetical protein
MVEKLESELRSKDLHIECFSKQLLKAEKEKSSLKEQGTLTDQLSWHSHKECLEQR